MSKKDYVLIAQALREEIEAWDGEAPVVSRVGVEAVTNVANRVADALKEDNPRFDRDRFLTAALGEEV